MNLIETSPLADIRTKATETRPAAPSAFRRLLKYTAVRLLTLTSMVVLSVLLTTVVANMGGYIDEVVKADIALQVGMMMRNNPEAQGLSAEERLQLMTDTAFAIEEAQGLHQPFLLRTVRWVTRALTLNWGNSKLPRIFFGGQYTFEVAAYVLERLPRTLLLFGSANLLLFFASIATALAVTHTHRGWIDRLIILLSPLSTAPPWVYGILLTVLAFQFPGRIMQLATARFDAWPTGLGWAGVPLVLRHMILPILSIFMSKFLQSVFAWRAFFLLHYDEDYVDLAKAKGVPARLLERRYILRPTLPSVLTNFALLLTSLWQEVIILEHFFNVEGVGKLFTMALNRNDIPLILALVVTFAYLLAVTVFILDIAYAWVDPRVRIGGEARLKVKSQRRVWHLPQWSPSRWRLPNGKALMQALKAWWSTSFGSLSYLWRELTQYPSALVGLAIIICMIGVAIYAVIAIPYPEAVRLWRGDQQTWYRNPQNALPTWVNIFLREKLPPTQVHSSRTDQIQKEVTIISPEITEVKMVFAFDYRYDRFPQALTTFLYTLPVTKSPYIELSWHTPDGREIRIGELTAAKEQEYRFAHDSRLVRRLGGEAPEQALFADPNAETPTPLKGRYELHVSGLIFEGAPELDAEFIIYGQVHGLAGTDDRRRDLMVAVLWGTAVALSFGILAAISTSLATMFLAAISAWYGGWVDQLLQRLTEVNMVLPFLPVSLMIFTLYSHSFWVLLGVVVLLSIFGSGLKNYRAIFLQTKQAPYIEAAHAYGASDHRIILNYLVPRIMPVLLPQLIILIPSYVFLESALAFLGLSDPILPTWGKLVHTAFSTNIFNGPYHLVLMPAIILLVTGLAFALLGHALERIYNPRLIGDL